MNEYQHHAFATLDRPLLAAAAQPARDEGFDTRLGQLRERFAKMPSCWMSYDLPRASKGFGG